MDFVAERLCRKVYESNININTIPTDITKP